MAQYLDASGLQNVWGKVKSHVSTAISTEDASVVTYVGTRITTEDSSMKSYVDGQIQSLDSSITAADESGTTYALKSVVITDGKITSGNKVAIPSVGNGVLTLKINDASIATTFSANQSGNTTIDLGDFDASGKAQELINALDASLDAGSGKYVSGVKQENGKITAISTGTVPTALKNPNAIEIHGNGANALTYDGSSTGVIDFVSGNNIDITVDASGEIEISAVDTVYTHPAATSGGNALTSGTALTPTLGTAFAVPTVKVDASGHVTTSSDVHNVTVSAAGGTVGDGSVVKYLTKAVVSSTGKLDGSVATADSTITASSTGIPTSAAVKTYVDGKVAGASNYLGTFTALTGLSTTAKKGDFMRAGAAIAAQSVHAGDLVIAEKDSPSQAIDGTNWTLIHCEMDTDTTYEFQTGVTNGTIGVKASTEDSFTDVAVKGLAAMAYKANVADGDITGTISDSHIASASDWNAKIDSLSVAAKTASSKAYAEIDATADGDTSVAFNIKGGSNINVSVSGSDVVIANSYSYTHPANAATGSALTAGTAQTPAFGGTFDVTDLKIDASGHVTDDSRKITVTIPATEASTSTKGLMTTAQVTKLNGITAGATADSSIPSATIDSICQ